MNRKTVAPIYSMCVQPSFIIGTNNEDGTYNFAPITWVSATHEEGDKYLLVISMSGDKTTKKNVIRTGIFSANLVNTAMLPLMDYLGSHHAQDGPKNDIDYKVGRGTVLNVPTLDASPWVYECEVAKSVETGDSTTFFCHIRGIQTDEKLICEDPFDVDLTVLDPVIYSGRYHNIDHMIGKIGEFKEIREDGSSEDSDILKAFHKHRMIMYLMFFIGLFVALIGCAYIMTFPIIIGAGLLIVLAAIVYGLFSNAMTCPYCGEMLGRRGFGTHCEYCGKKIF